MSLVCSIGLLAGAFFTFIAGEAMAGKNYLFDMGRATSRVEAGYTPVTPETRYNAQRGFGWLVPPVAAFDTMYSRITDTLFRDGVTGGGKMTFRVDARPGDYWVTLTMGSPGQEPVSIRANFNGRTTIGQVTTPWYRLPYRTVRRKVHVGKDGAVFGFSGVQGRIGLYSLELRAVDTISRLALSPGPDIAPGELDSLQNYLHAQLDRRPDDIVLVNAVHMQAKLAKANTYFELAGWSASAKQTGMNQIQRMYAAIDLLDQLVADPAGPLYHKSLYLLGKIHFWLVKEDRELLLENRTQEIFDELGRAFPAHRLIRMYRGRQVPEPYAPVTDMRNAPRWAVLQQEAMSRMTKVIHWWVKERQAANGELGGKYGDDVEMLRWWLPAILGADDSVAREGYTRMADGLWNSGELVNGYDRKLDDVEHAAELFRDSHTGMFMVRYGDPAYVERAMISMQNFEKVWSGITHKGHRHFRSYYFSATETLPRAPYGVDVPLNARALLPGLWTAWYNRNPAIIRLFSEWADAWVADAARADGGKPKGMLPAAIAFENEGMGGFKGTWYDPALHYDYYRWDHFSHIGELYSFLTGMHYLTGKPAYMEPLHAVAEWMSDAASADAATADAAAEKGTLGWVKQTLRTGGADQIPGANPFGNQFAMAARLTGDTAYHALIRQHASAYNRYQLSGNADELIGGFDRLLNALRYNFPLLTSEVKFTDRVYVPGSDLLMGMYTGHFGRGFEFPALVATWTNTGRETSVFVRKGDTRSALISIYNAGNAKRVGMNTWMLMPGSYKLTVGTDRDDDLVAETLRSETEVTIRERVASFGIDLPARGQVVVRMEQIRPLPLETHSLPDLALSEKDIRVEPSDDGGETNVYIKVHNIGNAASNAARALLLVDGSVADSCVVQPVESPDDLVPRACEIVLKYQSTRPEKQLIVELQTTERELNSGNNRVVVRYSRSFKEIPSP